MKQIAAIFSLLLISWCLAPWQLLCINHDHHYVHADAQLDAHENGNIIHGIHLDFFFTFTQQSKIKFLPSFENDAHFCHSAPQVIILSAKMETGRAPPAKG